MTPRRVNYRIEIADEQRIIIRDLGPWDAYLPVHAVADLVVVELAMLGLGNRRLFYYDHFGYLNEIRVRDGQFVGFGTGRD